MPLVPDAPKQRGDVNKRVARETVSASIERIASFAASHAIPSDEFDVHIGAAQRVTAHAVYAAGLQVFEATVLGATNATEAKRAIFTELPLLEHGWPFETTQVRHVGDRSRGMIWRVERGA